MASITRSPATMENLATVGVTAWSNPNNAKVSDNVYSTFLTSSVTKQSNYLKATNFGFSIPSGATINGIVVEIEKYATTGNNNVIDVVVKIVKADGTIGTTNKAATATSWPSFALQAYVSYGSSSDLWGETWDADKINDADFGVVLSATVNREIGAANGNVDHMIITVYYTEVVLGTSKFFQLFN